MFNNDNNGQQQQLNLSKPSGEGAYVVVSFVVFLLAHLILTFLFWLCINPTLKAFGGEAISFGAAFGMWSLFMMITIVPSIIVLNLVKAMWPEKKNDDLLLKLLLAPPAAIRNNSADDQQVK